MSVAGSRARPVSANPLVRRSLMREEVMGTSFATLAFRIVDAIW